MSTSKSFNCNFCLKNFSERKDVRRCMRGCMKEGNPVYTCQTCHIIGRKCHGDIHNISTVLEIYTASSKHDMEELKPEQLRGMLIEEIIVNNALREEIAVKNALREENERLKAELKNIRLGGDLIKNEPETMNLRVKILKRLK